MNKWRKLGPVFNPSALGERPDWMHEYAQAPNIVVFDEFIRVFFCCRPRPDANRQFVSRCAFVDLDRSNPLNIVNVAKSPVLELGGLGEFDEFGTYPFSVVRDGTDLFAIYGGWTRCVSVPFDVSLGAARSTDDGLSFRKLGRGPVLAASLHEPFVVTSPKIRRFNGTWYLFYTVGVKWFVENGRPEVVYKLRMATSANGTDWERTETNIMSDVLGNDEAQACPDVLYHNGKYHMFFCYRRAVDFRRNKSNTYRIGYASSSDLVTWRRDDAYAKIEPSTQGFDSEMVAYPTVIELDGRILMFYLGNEVGRYGFGLAEFEGELS